MERLAYPSRRYRQYVEWVAMNDNDGANDSPEEIAGYVTTVMIAQVNGLKPERVAEDVANIRRANGVPVGVGTHYERDCGMVSDWMKSVGIPERR